MKVTIALLPAAFAAVAVAAIGGPTSYPCETSDASPYLHNVNEMIDNLNNADVGENLCNPVKNGCGETITGYSGSGGAAFMICGTAMRVSYNLINSICITNIAVADTINV